MRALWQLFLFRWREFYREPAIIFWALVFPLVMMVVLGLAFRPQPPGPLPVLVAADAKDPLVAALASSSLQVLPRPLAEAERALARGEAALLVVPGTPATSISGPHPEAPQSPPYEFRFDPLHPDARQTKLLVEAVLAPRPSQGADRPQDAPGARYIDWLTPGLLGMQIMNGSLWGVGFALVEMRAKKLLKRFAVTPMRRWQFLLAAALHRFLIVAVEAVLMFGFAMLAFGVPLKGSLGAFAVFSAVGVFSFGCLALLVAARPRNTEVAAGVMNIPMLPQMFMSGVFFSASRFPDWMQPFVKALPLTALIDGMRRLANEGEGLGLESVARELVVLVAWAVGTLVVALRVFRWT